MNIYENCKRIVIKFGTNSLTREDGDLSMANIYNLIEIIAGMKKEGKEILVVSSGAVSFGVKKLGFTERPANIGFKQACAAVGQSRLMSIYEDGFSKHGIVTAQVLLTEDDFNCRSKYLNLSKTLNALIELNTIPIINENDTVSVAELEDQKENYKVKSFGDNDKLSALVMSKMNSDLLIIMSDVDGLYNADPKKIQEAQLIPVVKEITAEILSLGHKASANGRGGMKTKLEAAKIAVNSGGYAVILNGKKTESLRNFIKGDMRGTLFVPDSILPSKKRWIAYANTINGKITINTGAEDAIRNNHASILPAGIISIQESFSKGDVISIFNSKGNEIARGMTNYSHKEIDLIKGKKSAELKNLLGNENSPTVIRRENMVFI